MDLHLRVELDGDEPVVVKAGRGPAAAARLRRERRRLLAARHPGVVALVGTASDGDGGDGDGGDDETVELRTLYAGEPVASWTGTAGAVAGLVAAVATTLDDLHEVGIVHGRLDATHVLVGDDGRPRLCGFAGDEEATPADDVGALGRVLADLADRVSPPRRRLPWRGPDRAVRALHQVAARATDPVPTRRPTARVLAAALLEAVPDAALPAGPGRPRGAAAGTAPTTDTFERIWRLADLPPEHERWAAAVGSGPWARPSPEPTGDGGDGEAEHDGTDDPFAPANVGTPGGGRGPGPLPLALATTPPWGHPRHGADGPDEAGRPAAGGARRNGPIRPARRLVGAGGVAAAALALAGAGAATWARPGHEPDVAEPDGVAVHCPPVAPPAADVDGDGCPEPLSVDGTVVDAGVARWSLGEEGDRVALGDWDCDGEATPALLRPATGDVFAFDAWAEAGEPLTVTPAARVEGAADLRAEATGGGCDRLVVELTSGEVRAVEVDG
jgi:hypothetical protein